MVIREVPFGEHSLLYNWANIKKFYDEYGLRTIEEFEAFWDMKKAATLGLDDFIKIAFIGLQRKGKPVSLEEASEIVDEYMGDDKTVTDLMVTLYKAQLEGLVVQDTEGEQKGAAKARKSPIPSKS